MYRGCFAGIQNDVALERQLVQLVLCCVVVLSTGRVQHGSWNNRAFSPTHPLGRSIALRRVFGRLGAKHPLALEDRCFDHLVVIVLSSPRCSEGRFLFCHHQQMEMPDNFDDRSFEPVQSGSETEVFLKQRHADTLASFPVRMLLFQFILCVDFVPQRVESHGLFIGFVVCLWSR